MTIDLNELSKTIYKQNQLMGWWDGPKCIYQTLQLISTEIAEATEGERKGLYDDHLPPRLMGEVELADALVRTLDLGGRYGWLVDEETTPIAEATSNMSIAGKHLYLNACLIGLLHNLPRDLESPDGPLTYHYSRLVKSIIAVADSCGYDIEGALEEKLGYNRHRADHQKANRDRPGGKKF